MAIAATVLLSFTLVLQINRFESPGNFAAPADAPVVQPPPSTAAEAPPAMAATPAMAPSVARAGYRPRGHEERKRGDARHEVAPAAGREQDVAAPAAFNAAARVSIPAGVMAEQATADAAARDPQEWWALVQRLRQQGHPEEATRELEALRRAYPDFVPPR